ncbi:MAG: hypothetical protein US20_C0005G0007 [Candidatus Pacebacteria bacterium GW2011_GWF1_36_5]|nr:MAG: hypothetical protein US20_C0005G0007 [Candidatus Pacebacteria bacterium GW2011_GWF1_36_5]
MADVEINWFGEKVETEVLKAAIRGLKKCGEAILGEAKKQAPVDIGTLERSGTVNEISEGVEISFNTPYALKQHEIHKSKAKYLERPFNQHKVKAQGFVNRELNKL